MIFEVDFEGLVKSSRQKSSSTQVQRYESAYLGSNNGVMAPECKGTGYTENNSEMLAEACHGGIYIEFRGVWILTKQWKTIEDGLCGATCYAEVG